jgi:hypothetical protein
MSYGDGAFGGGAYGGFVIPPPSYGYGSGNYGDGLYGQSAYVADNAAGDAGFLLAEDEALLLALQGLWVVDQSDPHRNVSVLFEQPDPEIRKQIYPYITVDLIDAVENVSQVHSSYGPLDDPKWSYLANRPPYDATNYGPSDYLLSPMLMVYQVTTWSRHIRHDRSIIRQLMNGVFHPRFGQIHVPSDGTDRRVIVSNYIKRDTTDANQKRLYRNIWTIQIPSEIFYGALDLTARAQAVIINDETLPKNPPPGFVETVVYPI